MTAGVNPIIPNTRNMNTTPASYKKRWIQTGIVAGLAAAILYLSAWLPLPAGIRRLAFFFFGVLLIPSVIGLYHYFEQDGKKVTLQLASAFGMISGVLVNLTAVVQATIRLHMRDYITNAHDQESEDIIRWIWRGLESVQLGMNVSWNMFILSSMILFSLVVFSHKAFGKVFGIIGLTLAVFTLLLNLHTFPIPPGAVYGKFWDFMPLCGLWFLCVYIRILWIDYRDNLFN